MKFRLSIGFKLAFCLAVICIIGASVTVYQAYRQSHHLLTQSAKEKLMAATQVLASRYVFFMETATQDLIFLSSFPLVKHLSLLSERGSDDRESQQFIQQAFEDFLIAHPSYSKVRLIDANHYGRELVKVERNLDGVSHVDPAFLFEKKHFPYVYKTLNLPKGGIYVSDIGLDPLRGNPTLQIATPIHSKEGKAIGVLVINIDLNVLFNLIKVNIPSGIDIFLTNYRGHYLIHPNVDKKLGMSPSENFMIQNDIPQALDILNGVQSQTVTDLPINLDHEDRPSVTAMIRVPFSNDKTGYVLLGLMTSIDHIEAESQELGIHMVRLFAIFGVVIVLASLILASRLTKPLKRLTQAVNHLSEGEVLRDLPITRKDEVGDLARCFYIMADKLQAQFVALREQHKHLDHIAHHDQLTGLPSRNLLSQRMQQAIQTAHVQCSRLGLLFLDLDRFKPVNDDYGHDIGDQLLIEASMRMRNCVSNADTVARVGGDEFIILLPVVDSLTHVTEIAENIRKSLCMPFYIGGYSLHISSSIGVAVYPDHGLHDIELSKHADQAMYLAKKHGRNQVYVYAQSDAHVSNKL